MLTLVCPAHVRVCMCVQRTGRMAVWRYGVVALVSPPRLELAQRGEHLRRLRNELSPHAVLIVEWQTEALRLSADLRENLAVQREKERERKRKRERERERERVWV